MIRRALAVLRLAAWVALLWTVAAPWRELGGLVGERLRWTEWLVLWGAPPVGFTASLFATDAAGDPGRRPMVARILYYPPAVLTAAALCALAFLGQREVAGVVLTGGLAYTAGADAAWSAVPALRGRLSGDRPASPQPGPRPPWNRF